MKKIPGYSRLSHYLTSKISQTTLRNIPPHNTEHIKGMKNLGTSMDKVDCIPGLDNQRKKRFVSTKLKRTNFGEDKGR